jgi:DNA replication protein DnaC
LVTLDGFPELTPDWETILLRVRAHIVDKCGRCAPPDGLCHEHTRHFEWFVRMARANVPTRYWPLEIDETLVPEQEALTRVRDACATVTEFVGRGLGLSLFGNLGCGKTTLTIYLLKAALRAGFTGHFVLMESLLSIIKDSFEDTWVRGRFRDIKNVSVLVLDDLGREYMTTSGFVVARLDELIRYRDSMCLTTLFSSNLDGDTFKARYGEGIISLLSNTNKPLWVNPGDLRGRD